ncbi:hypothetical protein LPB136_10825 [Tenacibaculum todarodis]|uniref:MetA-pathway of phenol degradation n=1 Tax=Tenacibaculum todarodis TaxID=1850252 RepID=A0A1L3JKZ3_9FLAO|nr:hypothetical protein [Tenacibaculum todarodis]APG65826.1 hypothetical protein LPB136_10825 [Tenacibaculum todarodis]
MKKLTTLFIFLFTLSIFSQSPWTQNKGILYTQLSFTTIPKYKALFGNPEVATERQITDNTLRIYAEYGISNKTTLFTALPIKTVKAENLVKSTPNPITTKGTLTSMGNILFGVKHNFYNKKWLITGQVGFETSTSRYHTNSGVRTGYDAWTITPMISAGKSSNSWYVQTYVGADFRTNEYSSAFKIGGEIGYKLTSWLTMAGFADGLASFTNGSVIIPKENKLTGLYVNNKSYAAFGIKPTFVVNPKFGINLGVGLAFGGRRIPQTPAISAGFHYKFL